MRTTNRAILIAVFGCICLVAPATSKAAADMFQPEISAQYVKRMEDARAARRAGNLEQAIKILEAVTKEVPDYYLAHYNLGLAYGDGNKLDKAIAELAKAKEIKEKRNLHDATIYNSLGWSYILAGKYAEAERELKIGEQNKNSLNLNSQRRLVNNLGVLYMYKGDYQTSDKYLKAASEQYQSPMAKENLKQLELLKAKK